MKAHIILALCFFLLTACNSNSKGEKNITTEVILKEAAKKKIELTKEEVTLLKKVNKLHPEIKISQLATENIVNGVRFLELDFQSNLDSNNLYFGEYIGYKIVIIDEQLEFKIDYSYSAGQAFSAQGHISLNKITNKTIKVEYNYGTSLGTTEITVDGKIIFEQDNSF